MKLLGAAMIAASCGWLCAGKIRRERLALHLLEESSSRILKLVFCPGGRVELRLDETPPLMLALHMLEKTSPGALQVNLEQFKDLDYLWYCVERTCAPVLQSLPENGDGVFPPAPALM